MLLFCHWISESFFANAASAFFAEEEKIVP